MKKVSKINFLVLRKVYSKLLRNQILVNKKKKIRLSLVSTFINRAHQGRAVRQFLGAAVIKLITLV